MVVQEEHTEENKTEYDTKNHLHALIVFKSSGRTKSKLLKEIKKIYPNDYKRIWIKPAICPRNIFNYLSKEDENAVIIGVLDTTRKLSKENQKLLNDLEKSFLYDIPDTKILEICHKYEKHELSLKYLDLIDQLNYENVSDILYMVRNHRYNHDERSEKSLIKFNKLYRIFNDYIYYFYELK